ncbi:hypothetical protein Tco_1133215 [Tanacetum coccineum]
MQTLIVPSNNLGPDLVDKLVNETLYRGMIGSLMYLTVTRPDTQFSTCLCARYQANPKESHLIAVKRIFRYLKDSDYAGCNMDKKSTSGACQILEGKLVCWNAKKQQSDEKFGSPLTILSNSNFSKDPSKVTPIELTASMIGVNNRRTSVSPLPFTVKKKKKKSQTVTPTLPKSQGLEASGSLPQKRNKPADKGLTSTVPDEGTGKTKPLSEGPHGDKDSKGFKPPTDMEPLTTLVADISGTDAKYQETGESNFDSSCLEVLKKYDNWEKHEEAAASYADLKSKIEGFHDAAYKYGKDVEKILGSLKVIQDAVKEDPTLNKKVIEATEAYTRSSTNLTKLLTLIKSFDFQGLKSSVESLQASALRQDEHLAEWAKSSTSMAWNLGHRLTSIKST